MTAGERSDVWAAGDLYEPFIGRWSRLVARELLAWLEVPAGKAWLDVGCGTGALTEVILHTANPDSVTAIDLSPGFIAFAKTRVADPRASFKVGDAQSLQVESARFDAAVSGLVLNFVPQPQRAVGEMARAVRTGGVVAAYVWDYGGKMQMLRYFWDAAAALDRAAVELDEVRRFTICRPDQLKNLFSETGLSGIEVRAIDVPTRFRDFDDYWSPFLGGQGPAAGYAMSLSEGRRLALRDRLRATLPAATDGSIKLVARAWAVRGRAP